MEIIKKAPAKNSATAKGGAPARKPVKKPVNKKTNKGFDLKMPEIDLSKIKKLIGKYIK